MSSLLRATYLIVLIAVLGACRASFEDISKLKPSASDRQLQVPDETDTDLGDYKVKSREHRLTGEEALSHGCDGVWVIKESGRDINRDDVLQATEVEDIKSECIPNKKSDCPAQEDGKCQETPAQESPNQQKPNQSR